MSPVRVATTACTVAVALAFVGAGGGRSAPTAADAEWKRIEPGGKTRCARGGAYAFWTRVADPERLVVFFEGGGGCFDQTTCAVGNRWFDDSVGPEDDPAYARGVFDLADRRNPFRDWSWVMIPSCAGDVHVGDRRVRYGPVTVEQRGASARRGSAAQTASQLPVVPRMRAEALQLAGAGLLHDPCRRRLPPRLGGGPGFRP